MERDEIDERLDRLMSATHDVGAAADFTSRVMTTVEREPTGGIWGDLPRAAKIAVPIAAACAAASVVWALFAFRAVDDASLATQVAPEQSVVSSLYGSEAE